MNSESNRFEEPNDRTWLVWVGIVVLVGAMLAALALWSGNDSTRSLVRARHILITFKQADPLDRERALKLVMELRGRLESGESFADIARDYSQDPSSARRGGDLNYSERGAYTDSIEQFIWSAPVGTLSEVIETSYGFHLVRIDDRIISEVDRVIREQDREIREEINRQRERDLESADEP